MDITPDYKIIPFKDKVVLAADIFGQSVGGLQANSTSVQQGSGNEIFKISAKGLQLGAADFENAPFRVDMQGNATATSLNLTGSIINFGKTSFTDSTNAGYYISSDGIYMGSASDVTKLKYDIGTGAFDFVGTVSSRSTATLASAINSSGNLITNVINTNLDTSAKTILGNFTFSPSDYSGAFKTGDIAWNITTGAMR